MRLNRKTAVALSVCAGVVMSLAVWGHDLGLPEGALDAIQGTAATVGLLILASLRALFSRDDNHNSVPDVFEEALEKDETK